MMVTSCAGLIPPLSEYIPMEEIRLLERMTGKTAPGRAPGFTVTHFLHALSLLKEGRVGRKQLSQMLHLGEGTVRTMISRLSEENLVSVSRSGISLSQYGVEFMDQILHQIQWGSYPPTDLTVAGCNFYVHIRDLSGRIRYGVEQRDQAIIHGAMGASTFIQESGSWLMPGVDEFVELELSPPLDAVDGDVLIIGSGDDEFTARHGALSAAVKLLLQC